MRFTSVTFWFYLLVVSLPFTRIPSEVIFGLRVRPSFAIAFVFILLVLKKYPDTFKPTTNLIKILYSFITICVLSSLFSDNITHGLITTIYIAFCAAIALCVIKIFSEIKVKNLLLALGISSLSVCLFGFFQFYGDILGVPQTITGIKDAYTGYVFSFPRIHATALEPLYFANYLLLPISLFTGFCLYLKKLSVLLIIPIYAVLLTLSRGGIAAMFAVGILWLGYLIYLKSYRQAIIVLSIGAICLGFMILNFSVIVPKITPPAVHVDQPAIETYTAQATNYEIGENTVDRAFTRKIAVEAFYEHPLLGVGPGNYGRYLNKINSMYPVDQIANNEYLEILAETGIVGFSILVIFLFYMLKCGISLLKARKTHLTLLGIGCLVFLVATCIQYYSFSTLYVIHLWLTIGLLVGVMNEMEKNSHKVQNS